MPLPPPPLFPLRVRPQVPKHLDTDVVSHSPDDGETALASRNGGRSRKSVASSRQSTQGLRYRAGRATTGPWPAIVSETQLTSTLNHLLSPYIKYLSRHPRSRFRSHPAAGPTSTTGVSGLETAEAMKSAAGASPDAHDELPVGSDISRTATPSSGDAQSARFRRRRRECPVPGQVPAPLHAVDRVGRAASRPSPWSP